jgi:hypothetical protein
MRCGWAGFQRYLDYLDTLAEHRQATTAAKQLQQSEPLSPTNQDRLVTVLVEERDRTTMMGAKPYSLAVSYGAARMTDSASPAHLPAPCQGGTHWTAQCWSIDAPPRSTSPLRHARAWRSCWPVMDTPCHDQRRCTFAPMRSECCACEPVRASRKVHAGLPGVKSLINNAKGLT